METVLETEKLAKRYGDTYAVDGLSLSVCRGEIYGFLGMNGAGKTTTIRMLLGLVRPDAGNIYLFGKRFTPGSRKLLSRVGSMVEFPGFYENCTGRENLEIVSILSGVGKRDAVAEAMEIAGIKDDPRLKTVHYSLGMKQRLAIARAILNHPELIILDEPTNGLDPAGIRDIRNLLVSLARERGITVFMSSHLLSEVEQIADRVGVIHRGKLLEETTIAELRKKNRTFVEYGVSDENRAAMLLERDFGITDFEILDDGIIHVFSHLGEQEAVNRLFVENGIGVNRIWRSSTGLEEYFLALTGEKK